MRKLTGADLLWIWSGAPWSWASLPNDGTPIRQVHRFYRRYTWNRDGRLMHGLMAIGFIAGVPVVLGMIAVLTARHGRRVQREEGKGRARQAREQLALWRTQGVLPLSYYLFELYRGAMHTHALEYLYRQETKRGLYPLLRARFTSSETTAALQDKALFARHCEAHGVPAVPALFVAADGTIRRFDTAAAGLPQCDLFLKPLTGSGGRGAVLWSYIGGGRYQNAQMGILDEEQLAAHLRAQSWRQPHVGRAYVTNHPQLAEISSGALCSIRVVTCLDEHNQPEVTNAVLRMARTPGIVVDNFHAGGIAAQVNLDSGIVGRATDLGLHADTQWFDSHPTTGAPILGRQIPMWDRVLDVARRAHGAFGDQIIVGWDIAILDSGPHLIEGNKGPDFDIVQRTSRAPIGDSRIATLLAYHLRRALDAEPVLGSDKEPPSNGVPPREPDAWLPLEAHP